MLEIHAQIPRTVSWTYEGTFIGKSMNLHQVVDHPDNGWYFLLSDVKGGANNDYDAVVLHLDSTGQYVHHFSPARPGNPNGDPVFAKDIVVKENGNVLILAITAEETEGDDYGNPTLFEYTPEGERSWYRGYVDEGVYLINQSTEDARIDYWIQPSIDGGFVVGRFGLQNLKDTLNKTYGAGDNYSGFFKINSDGIIEWQSGFRSENGSIFMGTGFRNFNNSFSVIAACETDSHFFTGTSESYKAILTSFNSTGNLIDSSSFVLPYYPWIDVENLPFSDYNKVLVLSKNNTMVIGSWKWRVEKPSLHNNISSNQDDGFIFSVSEDGLNWFKSYGGTGIDKFQDAIKLNNGNILLVGHSSSNDGDLEGVAHVSNVWLTEIDTGGNIIDQFRFPIQDYGLISPQLWKVRQAANGDIILGFRTSNYGGFVALALSDNLTGVRSPSRNSPTMIYPNPAASEIYVSGVDSSQDFYIYSVEGSLVIEGVLDSENKTIDIQQLPAGLYYLKMGNAQIKRFIKK